VKWDDQPASLASIPEAVLRGYRIAMTEPRGPVYLCFDAALQEMPLAEEIPIPDSARYLPPARLGADDGALEEAARLLAAAEHPVIVAEYLGRNTEAVQALIELADLLAAPVIDLYRHGRFNFPNTHPMDLTGAGEDLLADADVVLALDVRDLFGTLARVDRVTRRAEPLSSPAARIIHITLSDFAVRSWAADYQRVASVDVPIAADTSLALPALVERLKALVKDDGARRGRYEHIRGTHERLRRESRARAQRTWDEVPIAPARLAHEVWEAIREEDWVLANGTLGGWARTLWEWTKPDQYLGYSGGAGLGYGMGASIGVALAHRGTGRLCVDLQPDGDLLYTPQALWTAAHHKIPLLVVVCNNRSYYNDEVHQDLMARARGRPVENRVIGIRLEGPPVDFAGMARGFGMYGEGPIEDPGAMGPALRRAIHVVREEGLPALVDVVIRST
jgi:thiamine pyrophosphate-dependent acetolactate synthase large subunit-like protein